MGLCPPQALVLLQLWANLDVLLVASWQELSQHVCAFTKALAQRPFKCVTPTSQEHLEGVVLPGPLKARGLSWGTGWSGLMKPLETPLFSPHQAVPRVRDLFLLHSWALEGRRARDKRWHRASGGLVATD